MFSYLYHTFIADPLYNGLILLMDAIPWVDAGVAVILFTIIIKLVLFPLSRKSVITQLRVKEIEPELNIVKEKYKNDKQVQAQEIMNLYRNKGINPFSGIFNILIQLPILIALYSIFLKSGLPVVNTDILYDFIKVPVVDMNFLGLINIADKSIILSIIAAVAQYLQIRYSLPPTPKAKPNASFQDDLARSVNMQMKFVFPIVILFISYTATATIALYLIVSSLFMIAQEIYIRKHLASYK